MRSEHKDVTVIVEADEIEASGVPIALFIDVIGRPLSPVSIAGMHRRDRREERRVWQ